MIIDREFNLNSAQKNAIRHYMGPAIVVAGAGTGKTAVISLRIAYLIQKRNIDQNNILALTFTEKAAAEMQDRVDELLPYGITDTEISTFHALGDKILRENGFSIGLQSDFVVMSNFQQIIVLQQVLSSLKLNHYKSLGNPYSFVQAVSRFISRLKDENINDKQFLQFSRKQQKSKLIDKSEKNRIKELSDIYCSYTKLCAEKGMIDYGDQIMLTNQLFSANPSVLSRYQDQYKFILVDEFQDTNFAQNYLIKLLAASHQNIMVVGDDDQSIYRFRGAAISNILYFTKDFPQTTQIVLNKNYRSKQKILDSAYKLIQNNNPYRLEIENKLNKKLIGLPGKSILNVDIKTTIVEEMEFVANKIVELHKKDKIAYKDIVILMRKNNQVKDIVHTLQKYSIPFEVAESQNLFEQPEVKVFLNFMRVINDPDASDAMYGLLVSDLYKIPLQDIAYLSSQAIRAHHSLEMYLRNSDNLIDSIVSTLDCIERFRTGVLDATAGQLLYQFLDESGYLARLVEEAENDSRTVQKIQNISQFFSLVKDFEISNSYDPHIFAFWRYLSDIQNSESDILIQPSVLDSNSISIMTIHKAKGLEYEVVFMIDLTEQTFPSRNMSDKILMPQALLSEDDSNIPWHIHEERRLFYVGITRAKSQLYLTSSFDHGGKRLKKPSRFITEATTHKIVQPEGYVGAQVEVIKSFAESSNNIIPSPIAKYLDYNGWLHLSTNQIADYLRSPKEFWYFDVLSLPKGPFHALVYGSAIHAAIELYYKAKLNKQPIKLKDLLVNFESKWRSEGFVSLQHEKDRYERGKKVLRQFYTREEKLSDLPIMVEKSFSLRIDKLKLQISGRYDAVYDRAGDIEILDFKTGDVDTVDVAKKRLNDSLQMKIYALAWEKSHQSPVKYTSLYFVEHNIKAISSKIDHNKTLELLKTVATGIREQKFASTGSSRVKFGSLL